MPSALLLLSTSPPAFLLYYGPSPSICSCTKGLLLAALMAATPMHHVQQLATCC